MTIDENGFKRVSWDDEHNPSDDDDELGMPLRPAGGAISAEDMELLTLAAQALGAVRVEPIEGEQWVNLHMADGSMIYAWNPLVHSADAFELASRLGLLVDFSSRAAMDINSTGENPGDWHGGTDDEPVASTRRAVTRAAAEIFRAEAQRFT